MASALYACERAGRPELGLRLVAVARRAMGESTELLTTEPMLAVILRLQCAAGKREAAANLFSYLSRQGLLRRRSCSSFLQYCCYGAKDRRWAFAAYEVALQHEIELSLEDYTALGVICVAVREPVQTLFYLLRQMQRHIDAVDEAMLERVIVPWLHQSNDGCSGVVYSMKKVDKLELTVPSCTPVERVSGDTALLSLPRELLSSAVGVCPCCNASLSGYPFLSTYRSHLLKELEEVVIPAACKGAQARRGFEHWRRYIHARHESGERIDILIDGANIGYYGLSSWYGIAKREQLLQRGVSAAQIKPEDVALSKMTYTATGARRGGVDVSVNFDMIDMALQVAVKEYGLKTPLVLLHERHVEQQNLTPRSAALVEQWRKQGWLYCTPTGLNDDLCWLHGALLFTEPTDAPLSGVSTTAAAAPSPPATPNPVPPQRHLTYVLTNDLMRDHHFRLLSPRYFKRWRDRHRIAFKCERVDGKTELRWCLPPPYERCIQEAVASSAAGLGGAKAEATRAAVAWHVPYDTPPRKAKGSEGAWSRLAPGEQRLPTEEQEEAELGEEPIAASSSWICICTRERSPG